MNTPISWIKAYVPELDVDINEFVDRMTLSGSHVECFEKKDKNLEKTVMNAKLSENADFAFKYREKMPLTWRLFHTEYDNYLSLTPESFKIIEKILEKLLPLYV